MKLSRLLLRSQLYHHFNLETRNDLELVSSHSRLWDLFQGQSKRREIILFPAISFQALVLANYRTVKEVTLVLSFLCRLFCPAQPVFQKTNNAAPKWVDFRPWIRTVKTSIPMSQSAEGVASLNCVELICTHWLFSITNLHLTSKLLMSKRVLRLQIVF